jgi:antitoxin component YwqK of YwqJK toxin-antitoxin module
MVQKERLHFSFIIFAVLAISFTSCSNTKKGDKINSYSFFVDTALILKDTVLLTAPNLKLYNGVYYVNNIPFSGYIKALFNNKVSMVASYLNGMQHGSSISYYPTGQLRFVRMYKENKSYGKYIGYWENGNSKFEF